ncbi:hypothetical protein ABPG74_006662 [Tetrahymena malaccensis]
MNKFLVLASLLAFTGFANAACATNAAADPNNASGCLCNAGYYGTDASASTGSCSPCSGNTSSTPGTTNTGVGINVGACNICVAGYYVSAIANTASSGTAATCSQCTGYATPSPQLKTASSNVGACNGCMLGYYYAAAAASASVTPTCTQCPQYSSTTTIQTSAGFCTCFDTNANSLSSTVSTCACKSGYKGTPAQTANAASTCTSNAVILSIFAALLSFVFII